MTAGDKKVAHRCDRISGRDSLTPFYADLRDLSIPLAMRPVGNALAMRVVGNALAVRSWLALSHDE